MTLYRGNQFIRDTVTHGVYHGSTPIKEIYKGSELVYQWHPYNPGTLIYNITGEATRTINLPFGVYRLDITGGGGNYHGPWAAGGYYFWATGGSGATFEGLIYLPNGGSMVLYAGGNVQESYVNFNGSRLITAGNGTSGRTAHAGEGGTLTRNTLSGIQYLTVYKSVDGNDGKVTPSGTASGAESTSSYGWGMGQYTTTGKIQQGGFRLEFIRRKP